jgi:hypothetical protein
MKVTANNKRLNIKDFSLELSNSALSIDSLSMRYDSLPDLPKLTDNVQYQGSVNASVVLKDIAPFVPALAKFDTPLHFNMDFSGKGKNIDCPTTDRQPQSDDQRRSIRCRLERRKKYVYHGKADRRKPE